MDVKFVNCVLLKFKESEFCLNQSFSILKTVLILLLKSVVFEWDNKMLVSSANKIGTYLSFTNLGKSFMKTMKGKGPKMHQVCTSAFSLHWLKSTFPFSTTHGDLSLDAILFLTTKSSMYFSPTLVILFLISLTPPSPQNTSMSLLVSWVMELFPVFELVPGLTKPITSKYLVKFSFILSAQPLMSLSPIRIIECLSPSSIFWGLPRFLC